MAEYIDKEKLFEKIFSLDSYGSDDDDTSFLDTGEVWDTISEMETAALVVFAISTLFGAEAKDGGNNVPVFICGGADEWYFEQFGRSPDDGLKAKKKQVADVLGSMVLGHFEDRRRYEAALAAITEPDKRDKFIAEWQDGRSSMNNIGAYCHKLAEELATHELL